MAGRAIAGIYAHMVKCRGCKVGSVMTVDAILVVGIGRYMTKQLTHTDHIVVAGVATAHKRRAGMSKGASAKGPRGVANTAILGGWHVFVERCGGRLTARCNTMTGVAPFTHNFGTAMIDKSASETLGVMAHPTI